MQYQAILVLYGHFVAIQIVQITFEFLTGLCRLGAVSLFSLSFERNVRDKKMTTVTRVSLARVHFPH